MFKYTVKGEQLERTCLQRNSVYKKKTQQVFRVIFQSVDINHGIFFTVHCIR